MHQALAFGSLNRNGRALSVLDLPSIVPEVELRQIAVKVLLANAEISFRCVMSLV